MIVWLIVGRATILRGDLLKNSLYIGHCQSRGGGDPLAQTDFATFQKWTNCPNSVSRGWGNLGNAQQKRFFSGRSFLRLSMKNVECLNILKEILRWTTTKEDPTSVATTDGTQWASRLTIMLEDDDNYHKSQMWHSRPWCQCWCHLGWWHLKYSR